MKLYPPSRRQRGFTLVELLVVIGIIALLISILLPALNKVREQALIAKCASNLKNIAAAMIQYANQNNGKYPRTFYYVQAGATTPQGNIDCSNTGGPPAGATAATAGTPNSFDTPTTVPYNCATASIYLLMKSSSMTPQVFACPASNAQPGFTTLKVLDWSNFEDTPLFGQTMSYSFNCPFPGASAIQQGWGWDSSSLSTDFALAGDINPGITGGYVPPNNVTIVTHSSSTRDMQAGNSNSHKNKGQNVLYGDYHVEFKATPFCGSPINNSQVPTPYLDNIYSARVMYEEGGKVSSNTYPFDALDTFLLPTDDPTGF